MLDKFRCDFIVHFYGAVFIPNKICMVTELAHYGSLQDVMKKYTTSDIQLKMKVKFVLDASKGISYLHTNGILHRDIKPDNILVFTFNVNDKANSKLTDFGSSRNLNMMMTNMTFTKGVGTPVYMAPEILQQEKYKKSADIYSLAITMFECLNWVHAYPKQKFKFPWTIAEYVIRGNRLPKPDEMSQGLFDIISNCWNSDPIKRCSIKEVIYKLELIYNSV
ncbi:serine/threonine protein kinase HT1, putative [Entamoeba invadens IP1]|uniref:Serine/threonine protein kinase HT1, putative n=1 Tax=Entamoeba invadens IP1 TaxID=370355 RepID=L7FP08_ENTIV|nr:serine/threonine protein kinase HT1, putative [Entamoeba invadens IP1]ELP89534.1 serine/threonine protein kinase HT1, putative [Entamoeba invadens IP1]|eukprot:XP_004256305.1 serine/threonine protein kinase HT1, putative [Entamoeba invadens IP1]